MSQLNQKMFDKIKEITDDIAAAVEDFDDAFDNYDSAEDLDDRTDARTQALEALDCILPNAQKIQELRDTIEED